jgi:hypothetical protein
MPLSPSASTSPSVSPSASPSISPSESASESPSISPSVSPSPSPGWKGYTRGNYATLPLNDNDLSVIYSDQDYIDVATIDQIRVSQSATGEYTVHQYRIYAGELIDHNECTIYWVGQTDLATSISPVYLQVYNQSTDEWETLFTESTCPANQDFSMDTYIVNLTNYKDDNFVVSFRIYQLSM